MPSSSNASSTRPGSRRQSSSGSGRGRRRSRIAQTTHPRVPSSLSKTFTALLIEPVTSWNTGSWSMGGVPLKDLHLTPQGELDHLGQCTRSSGRKSAIPLSLPRKCTRSSGRKSAIPLSPPPRNRDSYKGRPDQRRSAWGPASSFCCERVEIPAEAVLTSVGLLGTRRSPGPGTTGSS